MGLMEKEKKVSGKGKKEQVVKRERRRGKR
jgi:hypothetical protein